MGARPGRWVIAGSVLAGCLLAGCSFSGPGGEEVAIDAAPGADTPPIDAPSIDAPPIDCPSDYEAVTGLTSRYRLTAKGDYQQRHDDCKDDLAGRTHLVVIDTPQEGTQLRSSYNQNWWAGAVQQPDQLLPGASWFQITGAPLPAGLWALGQPNDISGLENNDQNVGLRRAGGLEDEPGTGNEAGLCECDGLPVDDTVEGYIPD